MAPLRAKVNDQARVTWFKMVVAISLSGRTASAAPSLMCPHEDAGKMIEHSTPYPLTRIIHERFCCNRGFAAATSLSAGGLAARLVDILFKDAFLPPGSARPSRFATPHFRDEPS